MRLFKRKVKRARSGSDEVRRVHHVDDGLVDAQQLLCAEDVGTTWVFVDPGEVAAGHDERTPGAPREVGYVVQLPAAHELQAPAVEDGRTFGEVLGGEALKDGGPAGGELGVRQLGQVLLGDDGECASTTDDGRGGVGVGPASTSLRGKGGRHGAGDPELVGGG